MTQVLLVDGMSVLVRASKAAQRARPLSHEGIPTGPLLMFAGTMAAHLGLMPWDYVVVSWEGVPELNWRREIFAGYKANRPQRDGEQISRDEELAREFCTAGGLFQDWAPEFEGDDIIAGWWRLFRRDMPEAQITILTSDRDLLQLCDENTVWRAWHDQVVTEADVREHWCVEPARLPLLRALAGDKIDGIPGVRGVGLIRATAVAQMPEPAGQVIELVGKEVSAEDRAQLWSWYAVTELRDPVRRHDPELSWLPRWDPASRAYEVSAFLAKYGMARMAYRQAGGKLPWPPDSE